MTEHPHASSSNSVLARVEDGLVALAALGIAIFPLADVAARQFFGTYVEGAEAFTAHLTLIVAMFGGAIAARDGKLLTLATGTLLPEGRVRDTAHVIAALIGAAVATVLAFSGIELLQVSRAANEMIARGIPVWVALLAFPIGFGLIALRLVWLASNNWTGRAVALVGIGLGLLAWFRPELFAGAPVWPGVIILIAGAVFGMPIFSLFGGITVFLYLVDNLSPTNATLNSYGQIINEGVTAIPLFTMAGFVLAEGRASERLLRFFRAFFGWIPGGTAVVTTILCAFFTVFTGGSGVTILALGGLLMPALLKDGYREKFSLGLLTSAGSLGLLFPPALPLILYGVVAQVSITQLFAGGLLPGTLMLACLAAFGVREGIAAGTHRTKFVPSEAMGALWEAKWELLLPIVILGSLFVGATTVQSAALATLYALVIQRFVHRDLANFAAVRGVMRDALSVVGGVLIILAVSVGFAQYLIDMQLPAQITAWVQQHIHSQWLFLLALNAFLIIVGALMDIFSAIFVVVPLMLPIAAEYQIDPIHLGIIFIANLELGYLTPPIGENLFLASYRFKKPVMHIAKAMMPMWIVLAMSVLLITYWPWLTSVLIRAFGVE